MIDRIDALKHWIEVLENCTPDHAGFAKPRRDALASMRQALAEESSGTEKPEVWVTPKLRPLASLAHEEIPRDAARYRYLRTMNPREFSVLWELNLRGGQRFDELIDARIKMREDEWNTRKRFGAS